MSQGVNALGTLILARLIAPADFGFFALFVTVVTLVSVFGGARYELAIMLPESDSEAANVAVVAVLAGLGIAAVSLVAIFILREPLAKFLGDPRIAGWLWSVPVVLVLSVLAEVARNWFGRTKDFRFVAAGRVSQSISVLAGQLGLWALHVSGGMALIGGWLLGQGVLSGVLLACMLAKHGRYIYASLDLSSLPTLAARYKAFPIYRAPYSFFANGTAQLIFVIFRFFCGLDVIGLYLLANRAVYLPVILFGGSMGQVFYQKAATEIKSKTLEPFVTRLARTQIAIGAPLLIFFAFEAPLLFDAILGPRWKLAGTFAAWFAFAGFLYLFAAWLVRLFDVCGRQRLALILQLAGGGMSLATLTLALHFSHSPTIGIASFTLSEVISTVVWLVCAYSIAGFQVRNLAVLGKDFVIAAAPIAGVGTVIHYLFSAWLACGLMALVTAVAVAVLWREYGQKASGPAWTINKFRRYWAEKDAPLHCGDSSEFRRECVGEIRALFPPHTPEHVLEVGCGDGSGFAYLDVPLEAYRGIDFSSHFLDAFRSLHPQADLQCAEGSSFVEPDTRYDVIFSNEVVQQFDPAMLDHHLQNASGMMHSGSVLILGSVQDRAHRWKFNAGLYSPVPKPRHVQPYVRLLISTCRRAFGLDFSGYWYTPAEISAMARRRGFGAQFVRSHLQPYRFHAVLSLEPVCSESLSTARPAAYPGALGTRDIPSRHQHAV